MKKSIAKRLFGKRFTLGDLFLILLVVPAIYFVYMGIKYEYGLLAVYQTFIALPLAFIVIGKVVLQNIINFSKK